MEIYMVASVGRNEPICTLEVKFCVIQVKTKLFLPS